MNESKINYNKTITMTQIEKMKFKDEFDVTASIFDFGSRLYSGQVSLREHFRCMPEIINFCSKHFYPHAPLIALRQYDTDRLPPLEHVFVSDGYRKDDVNKPEAKALVRAWRTELAGMGENGFQDNTNKENGGKENGP